MQSSILAATVSFTLASCGTLVQVVDARGAPIPGASVRPIYPSMGGTSATTDSNGYARLYDAWFRRPLFSMLPSWVVVITGDGSWQFDYPPPAVLHLDDAAKSPRSEPDDEAAAAASAPRQVL
jgi:hypothetical protein